MSLILLSVIAPVIVGPALVLVPASVRRAIMLLYIAGLFGLSFYLLTGAELGGVTLFRSPFQMETGLALLSFNEHIYSNIAAFGFLFVGAAGLLYALDVSSPGEQAFSIVAIASAVGVAFADNFLTLLFFWECLTISTTLLIFLRKTPHAVNMAYRVLFFSLVSGFSMTVGIVLQYSATGTFALMYPQAGLVFFIFGIGIKTAFLPVHLWVPWGYPSASFPSSVLLAALSTKVGVYAVARVLPPMEFINVMGALMAIFAVTFALLQSDLRRLLSFHIISQVGYMVAGVGLGVSYGVDGGMLHLVNHMIYKALLFMSAGALIYAVGTENLHDLHPHEHGHHAEPVEHEKTRLHYYEESKRVRTLWKALPIAFIGALAGALAISGTPFFNGYVSKYLIKKAMYGVNPAEWLLLVAGVGTSLSFAKFVYFGFIKAEGIVLRSLRTSMQAAIVILSLSCLVTGIWPQLLAQVLPYGSSLDVYSAAGIRAALQIIGIGIIAFIIVSPLLARELPKITFPFSVKIVIEGGFSSAYKEFFKGISEMLKGAPLGGMRFLQSLDYNAGKTAKSRVFNFLNIDLNVLMVIGMLAIALVFLFYLQFGVVGFVGW